MTVNISQFGYIKITRAMLLFAAFIYPQYPELKFLTNIKFYGKHGFLSVLVTVFHIMYMTFLM